MKVKAIYLDMDGTIVDLYGVDGWLADLESQNPRPYAIAKAMQNLSITARYLNKLNALGVHIGIISWLSKCGTAEYNAEVAEVKRKWLEKHLASVTFDSIAIAEYGTPKSTINPFDDDVCIIFDDEERNRTEWESARAHNIAYDVCNLNETLKKILKNF